MDKNKDKFYDEHSLGEQEQENSNSVSDVLQKARDVGENRSVALKSWQKKILNGGMHQSMLCFRFTHC